MFALKLYIAIAFILYIFLGLLLYKRNQLDVTTLFALLIFSIFWFPFCIYAILTKER